MAGKWFVKDMFYNYFGAVWFVGFVYYKILVCFLNPVYSAWLPLKQGQYFDSSFVPKLSIIFCHKASTLFISCLYSQG